MPTRRPRRFLRSLRAGPDWQRSLLPGRGGSRSRPKAVSAALLSIRRFGSTRGPKPCAPKAVFGRSQFTCSGEADSRTRPKAVHEIGEAVPAAGGSPTPAEGRSRNRPRPFTHSARGRSTSPHRPQAGVHDPCDVMSMSSVARTWPYGITAQPPTSKNSAFVSLSSISKSAKS